MLKQDGVVVGGADGLSYPDFWGSGEGGRSPLAGASGPRLNAGVAVVELTRHLHLFFPKLEGEVIEVEAETVAEVLRELERIAPGISFYVCDERGRLRKHVNIFIGDERIADRERLTDRVGADTRVLIMQALSGG